MSPVSPSLKRYLAKLVPVLLCLFSTSATLRSLELLFEDSLQSATAEMSNNNGLSEKAIPLHREEAGSDAEDSRLATHPTPEVDMVAKKDHAGHLEYGNPNDLSPEHMEYLMRRHGTTDLDPLPTMDPADPLNWPSWKVCLTPPAMRAGY